VKFDLWQLEQTEKDNTVEHFSVRVVHSSVSFQKRSLKFDSVNACSRK
jgi:hypothetical protein